MSKLGWHRGQKGSSLDDGFLSSFFHLRANYESKQNKRNIRFLSI